MSWQVSFHDQFVPEFEDSSEDVQDEVLAHLRVLEQFGPEPPEHAQEGGEEMTKSLDAVMASVSPKRRKKIEKRGQELAERQMTLQALRKQLNLTQEVIADSMNMKQANISKVEKRSDMLVSTVRSYVEAMGGKLELVARIPGHPPVKLEGFGDLTTEDNSRRPLRKGRDS